ncbi:IS66-like element accessory protein TnpA [Marinivivus vitaminiproducens]|uniref:IS66-like element accessory protein TnpA n=1 Tax=Marinivivus vitaminiproducens TaxID=3035935 RepID=UPI00279A0481|nr:transposase [Geminicoccaceae bacterium SCSIO 64248]
MQQSAQGLLDGQGSVVQRLEVVEGPTGRRNWPRESKARIVAESFAVGARVADVARRHRLQPQQVTAWRREARAGKLVLPADEELGFASLMLDEPPAPAVEVPPVSGSIEIVVEGVVVRLPGDSTPMRVAAIATALRAGMTAPGA